MSCMRGLLGVLPLIDKQKEIGDETGSRLRRSRFIFRSFAVVRAQKFVVSFIVAIVSVAVAPCMATARYFPRPSGPRLARQLPRTRPICLTRELSPPLRSFDRCFPPTRRAHLPVSWRCWREVCRSRCCNDFVLRIEFWSREGTWAHTRNRNWTRHYV